MRRHRVTRSLSERCSVILRCADGLGIGTIGAGRSGAMAAGISVDRFALMPDPDGASIDTVGAGTGGGAGNSKRKNRCEDNLSSGRGHKISSDHALVL